MNHCLGHRADRAIRWAAWSFLGLLVLIGAAVVGCSSPPGDADTTTLPVTSLQSAKTTEATEPTASTTAGQTTSTEAWARDVALFPVSVGDKMGYIDNTGKIVIEPQFDLAGDFSAGLAAVRLGMSWGYIDLSGKMVIQPQFTDVGDFSGGLASVQLEESGPYGFVDKSGKMVIQPQFFSGSGWAPKFSEGLALVAGEDANGFVDQTGNMVIPPRPGYEYRTDFSEGLAEVQKGANGPSGYIDMTGTMVIPPRFAGTLPFSEGLSGVWLDPRAYTWGYIDKTGKTVISLRCGEIGSFVGGLAWVDMDVAEGTVAMTYIDRTGKVIWQDQ